MQNPSLFPEIESWPLPVSFACHDNLGPLRIDSKSSVTECSLDSSPKTLLRCIAILGRRDEPTDAVEEYCQYLAQALRAEQIVLEIARVEWAKLGWPASLRKLRQQLKNPGNTHFILQYTALAWSRRGFPLRVLRLAQFLKRMGSRCVIVFHDPEAYRGTRWADILRRKTQLFVMHRLLRLADLAIFTLPREKMSWIPASARNVVFIPVGANLPNPEQAWTQPRTSESGAPGVAVFSVTGSTAESQEVTVITEAVAYAAKEVGPVRLAVFGRNSETAGENLKKKLNGCPVEVSVFGLIPAEEIVRVMAACDVLLFVRGPISSMRGSAIAGIACGLPVIAREGAKTAPPITDAGVVLLSPDANDFGPALARVLTDRAYNAMLSERSRNAQKLYFSWSAIAAKYAEALRKIVSTR